jgi:hypothetical protein
MVRFTDCDGVSVTGVSLLNSVDWTLLTRRYAPARTHHRPGLVRCVWS